VPLTEDQLELQKRVSPRIQAIASFQNPIDLTGSAIDDDFVEAGRFLSRKPEIDCVLVLLLPYTPGITPDLGARLSQIYRQEGKSLIAYVPHVEKYGMFIEGFQLNRVPVAHSIDEAVHMAEALRRHHRVKKSLKSLRVKTRLGLGLKPTYLLSSAEVPRFIWTTKVEEAFRFAKRWVILL
jgi:acyl-CoA synthetase (NDP forming)